MIFNTWTDWVWNINLTSLFQINYILVSLCLPLLPMLLYECSRYVTLWGCPWSPKYYFLYYNIVSYEHKGLHTLWISEWLKTLVLPLANIQESVHKGQQKNRHWRQSDRQNHLGTAPVERRKTDTIIHSHILIKMRLINHPTIKLPASFISVLYIMQQVVKFPYE